jgi:hypothetical protein
MNKKYSIALVFSFFVLLVCNYSKLYTNSAQPQAGEAGAPPSHTTCNSCHSGNTTPFNPGDVIISKTLPGNVVPFPTFKYDLNVTYTLGFVCNLGQNGSTPKYGFEMTALDASNNQAGQFQTISGSSPGTSLPQGTKYIGHHNANGQKNWSFRWISPTTNVGPITFYYTYNNADGDGSDAGDNIYSGSVTIQPNTTGITEFEQTTAFKSFPNPVVDNFTMNYTLTEAALVDATLYTIEGKEAAVLIHETKNGGEHTSSASIGRNLPSGIYLLKFTAGEQSLTKKIVIQ